VKYVEFLVRICFATKVKERKGGEAKNLLTEQIKAVLS
jgi:hypothetical protein